MSTDMPEAVRKRRDELAEEYLEVECYAMDGSGPHRTTYLAGYDAGWAEGQARIEELENNIMKLVLEKDPDCSVKQLAIIHQKKVIASLQEKLTAAQAELAESKDLHVRRDEYAKAMIAEHEAEMEKLRERLSEAIEDAAGESL